MRTYFPKIRFNSDLFLTAVVFAGLLGSISSLNALTVDNLVVSNKVSQKGLTSTNTVYGTTTIPKKGDISMGVFTNGSAAKPSWWTNRNVLVIGASHSDYSPVIFGQLKWFAAKAKDELDNKLIGGSGTNVANMVSGFSSGNSYFAVNIGQLKYVAKPFYDRLIDKGFTNNCYPWTTSTSDDFNYAAANLGQLKNSFSFDLGKDSDGDGLPDWVETGTGTFISPYNTGTSPTKYDTDGDGISDGAEVVARTDPNIADTTKPVITISFPTNNYKLIWMP